MTEIYRSNIVDVHCEVFVDTKKGTIHVLDVNAPYTSVTNGIGDIREQITEKHRLAGTVESWTWVIYGTDGIASVYQNGGYLPAPKHILHPPFEEHIKSYQHQ